MTVRGSAKPSYGTVTICQQDEGSRRLCSREESFVLGAVEARSISALDGKVLRLLEK